MEEIDFGPTEMAWNGESLFWAHWNGMQRRKFILTWLERLRIEEVDFGLTEMA
jgi:hypothetical protein